MVDVKITIPKLGKLQSALRKYPQFSARHVNDAIRKSIQQIDREAAPLTPRKTGHLMRSLGEGKEFGPLRGKIFSNLSYAVPQHERTDFLHPRGGEAGFLEKGVKNATREIQGFFRIALERAMEDIKSFT